MSPAVERRPRAFAAAAGRRGGCRLSWCGAEPLVAVAPAQEFELCLLKVEGGERLTQKEYKWSVWHRYSDFKELDR